MARVKRGVTAHRRHRQVLKDAKGYRGSRSRLFTVAVEAVNRGMASAFGDRRRRKRDFRRLWVTRINAGARLHGMTYGQLMGGLKKANVELDRKMLADLAVRDPDVFGAVVEVAKGTA